MDKKIIFVLFTIFTTYLSSQSTTVVISEVYGGGGGTSATIPFKNDFVELYNKSDADMEMKDWSIQYNSATGTNNYQFNVFSGTIKAKSFFLIQLGGGSAGADLPAADFVGNLNLSATNGRVALCKNNLALPANSPSNAENIVDLVGYGNAITFEGTAAIVLSNTTALERKANAVSTETSMALNGADYLAGNGYDTNNNSTDFVRLVPNPQNSKSPAEGSSTSAPSIVLSPLTINFGNVSSGSISPITKISINSSNITKSLQIITSSDFLISKTQTGPFLDTIVLAASELNNLKEIFVVFTPIALGNYVGSIRFLSAEVPSISSIVLTGFGIKSGDYLYDFNNCVSGLSDGFTQFSLTGAQEWLCTTFGRDASDGAGKASKASGVQISGFQTVANANTDWLLSPEIQILDNTSLYPTLSFYSRTRFAGPSLSLKVSKNYVKGSNPNAAQNTWEDINVKFPASDTDTWTLSSPVDLSKYRGQKITLAWVYTSTSSDAPRWTLDDIEITHKSTPPVGALNLSSKSLYFGYVAVGSSKIDSFSIDANPFDDDVTVSVTTPYSISIDNISYRNSIVIKSNQNAIKTKLYIKVNPLATDRYHIDTVFLKVDNVVKEKIVVNTNTFDQAKTLDVISYNIEWFGGINGPANDSLQVENAKSLLKKVNGDVYGLTEIVDTTDLKTLTASLGTKTDDFGYFVSNYASNVSIASDPNYANAQKLAYVYRKSVIKPLKVEPLFYTSDVSSTDYNIWTSGRFPYTLTAEVTLGNNKKEVTFVLIHGKAQNSADAFSRRKSAAQRLHSHIISNLKDKNVVILGDFNDDLDETVGSQIQVGSEWPRSSYEIFVKDTSHFVPLTLPLSNAGESSTARFGNVIDHIIISKNLSSSYLANSTQILDELSNLIPNYSTTTTDHYPVKARFIFETITNFDQVEEAATFTIYPNPSSGIFYLDNQSDNGKFEIYDQKGKLLQNIQITDHQRNINLEALQSGVYIAVWKSGGKSKKFNIVKI